MGYGLEWENCQCIRTGKKKKKRTVGRLSTHKTLGFGRPRLGQYGIFATTIEIKNTFCRCWRGGLPIKGGGNCSVRGQA